MVTHRGKCFSNNDISHFVVPMKRQILGFCFTLAMLLSVALMSILKILVWLFWLFLHSYFFHTGTKLESRYADITSLGWTLVSNICKVIAGYHAFS